MLLGAVLAIVAGFGVGSAAWAFKALKRLPFECWMFAGVFLMLIVFPWATILGYYPNPIQTIEAVGWQTILLANIFSFGWGFANVFCAIGFLRIGVALTNGILGGFGIMLGVTIPMIFKGSGLFSKSPDIGSSAGLIVMAGVAVMVIGVATASYAGHLRDQSTVKQPSEFLKSIIIVVAAGILSSGPVFVNAYSQEAVTTAFQAQRPGDLPASMAVWGLGMFAGAVVNLVYAGYLIVKNRSWRKLFNCGVEIGLPFASAVQCIFGFALLNVGSKMLGVLGASVGWGLFQAMQIMGGQFVGFVTGEWKGSDPRPKKTMISAIALLLFASSVLAIGNYIASKP